MSTALLSTLVLVVSFALSAALVPLAGAIARRFDILDHPGPRKIHDRATPRVGGIAVWAAFTTVVLAGYFGFPLLERLSFVQAHFPGPIGFLRESYRVEGKLLAVVLGGAVAFVVGLLDDVLGRDFGPAGSWPGRPSPRSRSSRAACARTSCTTSGRTSR